MSGSRHAVHLLRALPVWCGVDLAVREGGGIRFITLREPMLNPRSENLASAHLLYRHEIASLMAQVATRATRAELSKKFADTLPFSVIQQKVAKTLMQRNGKAAQRSTSRGD